MARARINASTSSSTCVGPLVFIHIPKCSGTAFETYVRSIDRIGTFSRAFTGVGIKHQPETLSEYFDNSASNPFIYGHISFSEFPTSFSGALYSTFVRDPVARTISHYNSWHDPRNFHSEDPHFLAADAALKDALLFAQRATLDEFVDSDNPIIRAGALGNMQMSYLAMSRNSSLDEQLASAKRNLGDFAFFGLTERFDDSIGWFRSIFADAPAYELHRSAENRSRVDQGELSPKVVDKIREQTYHDALLYQYAVELFEERFRAHSRGQRKFLISSLLPEIVELRLRIKRQEESQRDASVENARKLDMIQAANCSLMAQLAELERRHKQDVAAIAYGVQTLVEDQKRSFGTQLAELEQRHEQHAFAGEYRMQSLVEENKLLKERVEQLSSLYLQSIKAYRDIVTSRAWRLVELLQSTIDWFRRK